jgi:nucleotide-binding universal stress UspA family protein
MSASWMTTSDLLRTCEDPARSTPACAGIAHSLVGTRATARGLIRETNVVMKLPRSILVPVDFSEFSVHALDYALALAGKLDAKIHLLNVLGLPSIGVSELGVGLAASVIDDMVKSNQAELDKLANARRKTSRIGDVMLRTGDARDLILRACEEVHADLIVMGTHGRRGIRRALLGSVAESVVRTAPCPVLTIRGPMTPSK